MIQDYLKTSLVFYDDILKQHRYNDCCQDGTSYDGLISNDNRLLPFQIRIPTDEWVGDIQSVTLYDDADIAVANLITGYGIRPLLELVSNCTWNDTYVWIIYNGGLLTNGLPRGLHYIKITDDAGHAWYSEIFQICDMVESGFILGDELITEWNNCHAPNDYDVFTSDGNEITAATEVGPGSVYCSTNRLCGFEGDVIYYDIDWVQAGTNCGFAAYRYTFGCPGFPAGDIISAEVVLGATGEYTGELTLTDSGPFVLMVRSNAGGGADFTGIFSAKIENITTYDGCIGLEWYNDCDFDGIIYQEKDAWYTQICGYFNKLYFQKHLESPRTETTRDEAERLGTRFVRSIVQKKYYMFKVYVPEFLYNVIQTVALYANPVRSGVTIYLDNGDVGYIKELNIASEEWTEGNCYCHLTIEFREDAVVWTNCCDNYALRDESSC